MTRSTTFALRALQFFSQPVTLQSILAGFAPLLWHNGTLNGSNIANLGSLGATLDGVPTAVTLDGNGMNFNGTTSIVTIPNHAGWADVINSGVYTILAIAKATLIGENNSGRIWAVGASSHTCSASVTPTLVPSIARATTPATSSTTNPITAYPSAKFMVFMGWDGTNISGHSGKAGEVALTAGTNSNGSGAVTSVGAGTLLLGNRAGADRTWDGSIHTWALIPRVLSLDERLQAFTASLPYLNAA